MWYTGYTGSVPSVSPVVSRSASPAPENKGRESASEVKNGNAASVIGAPISDPKSIVIKSLPRAKSEPDLLVTKTDSQLPIVLSRSVPDLKLAMLPAPPVNASKRILIEWNGSHYLSSAFVNSSMGSEPVTLPGPVESGASSPARNPLFSEFGFDY